MTSHLDLEEADFAIVFPLQGKGCVRLVGTVRDPPGGESPALTFEDVSGRAIANLRLAVKKVNWFSTYQVHHRVASRFRDGRVFLLGDAAHIHSPVVVSRPAGRVRRPGGRPGRPRPAEGLFSW